VSGRITRDLVDNLRRQADIVEIIGGYVALRKQGQNYTGLCPFHQEKTPSFVVSPAKQIYHCFGCGKGGDVLTFLMEQEGLGFQEAAEKLATRYGIALPSRELTAAQQRQEAQTKRLRQVNQWAMAVYQEALAGAAGTPGREYFRRRELTADTIRRFCLGYAPDRWDYLTLALRAKEVADEEMILLGLATRSQRGGLIDRFRGRVIFPILDDRENVTGFGGRIIDEGQPKYLNSQESPLFHKGSGLYGLHIAKGAIRQLDQVVIMEGYMDALAAHQYGIANAVASLGTALTAEQVRLLTRYTFRTLLCFDADGAGQAAALRGMEVLEQQDCRIGVVRIPSGKDPDEFLRQQGREAFQRQIDQASSLFEYKFQLNKEKFDQDTMAGKVAIIQATLPDLAKVRSPVARQGYVTLMAEALRFPEPAIRDELRRYFGGGKRSAGQESVRPTQAETAADAAQSIVIRGLLRDMPYLEKVEAAGGEGLFVHPAARGLYQTLLALWQAGYTSLTEGDMVALSDRREERDWLTGILLAAEVPGEAEKVLRDSLLTLRRQLMERQIKGMMERLAALEKAGDISAAREVMAALSSLNMAKQKLRLRV
jgi:DNA primase